MPNIDYVVMSAPALMAGLAGYGFSKLEEKKSCPAKFIGFFGLRISVITFHVTSLVTLVYAIFKSVVLTSLNLITFNKIRCLRASQQQTNIALRMMFLANEKKPPSTGTA